MPSMLTVLSLLDTSSFFGTSSGGVLYTLFDGVRLLFNVNPHWLPTLWSVGAFSLTVPSKRTSTRGFWPLPQFAFTYAAVKARRKLWDFSSHFVAYCFLEMVLPVSRSRTSRVCLSGTRYWSYVSVKTTCSTSYASWDGSFGVVASWYSTFWPGNTTLPCTLSCSPPWLASPTTSFPAGGT